ncbi:hypothetical protein N7540_002406 [Penicillium herquei]|nr:hypothetical protein N7540_002406 [Penicillium herquei]
MSGSFSMKGGWHPKGKDGKSKESWRGDFKGINQVAGWMGKGKDPNSEENDHVSRPLSTLKDPSSFGPPPKHINYHGPAALPNEITPDRRGLGAPLSQDHIEQQRAQQQEAIQAEEEAAQKPKPPPVPYRVNTTGLSTNNLPAPPVRRLDSPSSESPTSAKPPTKPKPQLPPRLPPRTGSPAQTPSPPPAYSAVTPSPSQGYVNQEAASRLANAGVSVPALGIGETTRATQSPASDNDASINELQSRFSQVRTNTGSSSPAPEPPTRASHPTRSVEGLAPLPGFRDRHAGTIDAGKKKFGGMTSRINTFVEDRKFSANANKRMPRPGVPNSPVKPATPATPASPRSSPAPVPGPRPTTTPTPAPAPALISLEAQARKKPPPPPPKRPEMRAPPTNNDATPVSSSAPAPPPVPLSTKPR